MLFNSYLFIFLFLPLVLLGYYSVGIIFSRKAANYWLLLSSLVFYAWWNPPYLLLLLLSIAVNYFIALQLIKNNEARNYSRKKIWLTLGVVANLALLGYFKYANFFVDNINYWIDGDYHLAAIVLPLAISFFTFQQIAFLVDTSRGHINSLNVANYALFVSFFPQLISGPIVLHNEMMPQFESNDNFTKINEQLAAGLALFAIGLFKKVIIADSMGEIADPMFDGVALSAGVDPGYAWWALLAYAFQIYFDFSAYSDMAVGLGFMFGINLPLNFNSPYKAANIFEFWNRWHMTFARFMRNHVYIPLVRNKRLKISHQIGLIISVLLGGLWHGANWTFVIWGGLHASFMLINHAWHVIRRHLGHDLARRTRWGIALGILITFVAGMLTRVFFRADSISDAWIIVKSMAGFHETGDVVGQILGGAGYSLYQGISFAVLFAIVWILPNSQQWLRNFRVGIEPLGRKDKFTGQVLGSAKKQWPFFTLSPKWAIIISILLTIAVMNISHTQEFIYFQF